MRRSRIKFAVWGIIAGALMFWVLLFCYRDSFWQVKREHGFTLPKEYIDLKTYGNGWMSWKCDCHSNTFFRTSDSEFLAWIDTVNVKSPMGSTGVSALGRANIYRYLPETADQYLVTFHTYLPNMKPGFRTEIARIQRENDIVYCLTSATYEECD